jgi:CRISPR/Cas system CSM-associated protein Csm3 (group 7 of RAMP superfamily)
MAIVRNQTYRKYAVIITAEQPLRVGGYKDPISDVDAPLAMVGDQIVIPGSSLKGAYRNELENYLILNHADQNGAMRPCIPAAWNNLSHDERALIREQHKYKGECCGYDYKSGRQENICPTCYLLGTMGLVGFVLVPYLVTGADPEEGYAVRRDRVLGKAADRSNRSVLLMPPGTVFTGELSVLLEDKVRGWELGQPRPLKSRRYSDAWLKQPWPVEEVLQELVVERLEAIARIGGYISKGFGNVSVKVEPVAA